ncbi:nucleotide-binding protein [Nonomuraea sp. NBC_00507]|uniref:nucleotide-binding protein n=1 Tax=Nonomuraea sp. NBC_00507 TaxID=2976002 RepID=UPI002E1984FD
MEKSKGYGSVKFTPEVIQEAFDRLLVDERISRYGTLRTYNGQESWNFDDFNEFAADCRKDGSLYYFKVDFYRKNEGQVAHLNVTWEQSGARVDISAPTRGEIERVFDVFEQALEKCRIAETRPTPEPPSIFIGHGRDSAWRDLKDHLEDHHGYRVIAYETGARGGHTIRDILQEMLSEAAFALLVMAREDETADGNWRARQNVVHEAGLFQGKLGFHRALAVIQEGCEVFSNMDGIQQLRYQNSIREIFGDVLATLKREFS